MSFDATISGATANSYATIAQADAYFALRINATAWVALTEAQKQAYLYTSTMMLETTADWRGVKTLTTQALHFPAYGLYDERGNMLDDDALPPMLVEAVCEQAFYLLQTDVTALPAAIRKGLKSLKTGPVAMTFDRNMVANQIAEMVPGMIRRIGTISKAPGGFQNNPVLRG